MNIQIVLFSAGAAFCAAWGVLLIVKGLVEQSVRRQEGISMVVDITQFVCAFMFLWLAFLLHGGF